MIENPALEKKATATNIEDAYPASPVQEGMLFHSLYEQGSGVYITQIVCSLRGLRPALFEQAWQRVVERHQILRTAFVWKSVEKPLQVVGRRVRVAVKQMDRRDVSDAERDERFKTYLAEDRRRGFDVAKAPLMRLALWREADDAYKFVWSHHHLLLDGWAAAVVLKEVFLIYEALSQGAELELERARPYKDYIAWLQRQDIAGAENFWRETLKGFTAPTPFNVDSARRLGAERQEGYGTRTLRLSEDATARLQSLGRSRQLTLNTLVQGAWAMMLSRYSGRDDVLFGSVAAGRPAELDGVNDMVGLFINTLPVRVRVAGGETAAVWLRDLQARQSRARSYEFSPLAEVQRWSEIGGGQQLFDNYIVFENYPIDEALKSQAKSFAIDNVESSEQSSYPLVLAVMPGARLTLHIHHDRGRFEDATVERMLGHVATLLEAFVADPEQRLEQLPWLTSHERRQLLNEFNETTAAAASDACIHELFEAQAGRTPGAVAVVDESGRLTYAELNARANQLARHLRTLGVVPEDRVGLCVKRSAEMVVGLLGILKAGGVYVPLDPAYPRERLEFMLEDAAATVLVTESRVEKLSLSGRGVQVVYLDAGEVAHERAEDSARAASPANLAYVIYTSGSTGTPKGVAVTHEAATSHFRAIQEVFALSADDRCLQFASQSFDVSLEQILAPLLAGARIVLRGDEVWGVSDLAACLRAERLTVVNFPPAFWQQLTQEAMADTDFGDPHNLRLAIVGGDLMLAETARRWMSTPLSEARLLNAYGPTEATITATTFEATTHAVAAATNALPIGRAVGARSIYILDGAGEPVPLGVWGELHIGGGLLARGYLNRPELTAERFVPDSFSGAAGGRLYKTGDVARYLPDGTVEFSGRADQQVKIRGFRIELGEIEAALGRHPSVSEAVVLAEDAASGDKQIVAYVVSSRGTEPTNDKWREFLKEWLPDHMIPAAFVNLEALPLTPNGKVDRRALADLEAAKPQATEDLEEGLRTETEEAIANVWAEVLDLEQVGVNDNFFELGGHSLLATQVVSRLRKKFKVDLPFRTLFEEPTVRAVAHRIEESLKASTRTAEALAEVSTIPRAPRSSPLPLSFAQQRFWFLHQLDPNSPSYNVPASVALSGSLNVSAFTAALNEVVRRHEILRTIFTSVGDQPAQLVVPSLELTLPLTDLSHLPANLRRPRALQLATEEARQPFDLTRAPLLRARLLHLEENEHVLLLTMHHIISDGWSLGLLIKEMASLYEAYSVGRESPLVELPIQYADYALWQRRQLTGATLEEHLTYWKNQLTGASALELPTDRPRPRAQTFSGARHSFRLSPPLSASLLELGRGEQATLFMTLLAAFQVLLSRYSGQSDISVGTPVAGRTRTEAEGLIGLFVNTLVVRVGVGGEESFAGVLGRVREACVGAQQHQELPFEQLVDALQPERMLNRHPLFDVMFVLQNTLLPNLQLPGLQLNPLPVETGGAKFDLTLEIEPTDDGLSAAIEYNADLFDRETVARLAAAYLRLLEAVAKDPRQPVSRLSLLGQEERRRLVHNFNDTAHLYPPAMLPDMFRQQARRTPVAVAVESGARRMSYAELDERSERLARRLRRMGVGAESVIAILLERSAEMIVSLLGVLKAGGAYLPLDPSNPAERLRFMLSDSGARLLLTERRFIDALPEHEVQVLCLDEELLTGDDDSLAGVDDNNVVTCGSAPGNLAYVIYTSGSTGTPKGVMVTHGGLSNYLRWCADAYEAASGAGAPVHSPLSFDLTVTSLWSPLISGTRAVLVDAGVGVEGLAAALRAGEEFTLLKLTPAHLEPLAAALAEKTGAAAARATESASSVAEAGLAGRVRRLVVGGEALHAEQLQWWREHAPQTLVVNEYGPTETVVGCCVYERAAGDLASGTVPIGRPIANTQLYVLDGWTELVPEGVWGELYVGGAGVARGYLNRAGLTAERFVPDAFSGEAGTRLYRTGDIVRWGISGEMEYAGRADGQVKVRGHRVEVGEIEAALRGHALIEDAAVVVQDTANGKRLVAYVVAEDESVLKMGELREYLKTMLPEYMIPQSFLMLDELPLTTNGKVDRQSLLKLDAKALTAGETFIAPRTVFEEMVAGIWRDLLEADSIGVHDNFFERGGHSLLATRVVSRLRATFGVEFALRSFFEAPTVAQIAAHLETLQRSGAAARRTAIGRYERNGDAPLSFAQERLWFLEQLQPDSALYHINVAASLTGRLDVTALEKALNEIIRRHEVLRTSFVATGGEPHQLIAPTFELSLPLTDLTQLPTVDRAEAAQTLANEEARQPFDLTRAPLLRTRLLRLEENEHVLLLTMHHIISDGWSMGVFIREATELYGTYSEGRESPLEELPMQYADYAMWQREQLTGAAMDEQLDYWRVQLRGARTLHLPMDRPRPPVPSYKGADESLALPDDLSGALKALAGREDVTLFMLLLAAFQVLLAERAGHEDISVGTDIANRNLLETENHIGFFINQLVLRTDLSGDPSFQEVLKRVREVTLGAYARQDLPFDRLVDALKVERSLHVTPLFQVKVIFQNAPMPPIKLPDLAVSVLNNDGDASKFDLTLALYEEAGAIKGWFEYNTDLFDAATIARLGDDYATLLQHFASQPASSLGDVRKLLSESHLRHRLAREHEARESLAQKLKTARRKPVSVTPQEVLD
jgi:amino acid adenylation domain-containing protein